MMAQGLLHATLALPFWGPFIENFGYSLGFLVVVLGRQQLFTENTLTVILPLLAHPDWRTLRRIVRLWTIVLLANLVGALMVWLLPSAEGSRLTIIIIITYFVALGGFAHIIAGSVEVLYLVNLGAASWLTFFIGFMLPTLIGNCIGGVLLVAMLNFGQVS
jgi:formate/nitrite transporter FocA (FNT family)